ncbi:ABC transporter substrate-binding protein [Natrialba asiatica]|uniref:Family 1 extracellular solute-binding protein n=1 Tax=Natrialba asiatica (strain ATCC 700177 / DSM 12278 / JCM 9576 / FERM P-10747 / NBRC 102637 / 172P1) TaxID=29540 RepID=M0B3Y7_NATA1|nr:extracellular solute-binding protein [Natrialba asiatica]ELZ05495.1 family 1 extracellular solute-binding protein [Natrialba asiatica DSM 12278]
MASQMPRRQFIITAGSVGAAGSAGCLSDIVDRSTGAGNTNEYWEYFHSQSEVAAELMETSVEEFQREQDAQLEMNWSTWDDINGGKWKNNIQNGNRPLLYDSTNSLTGQFIEPGWVKPVSEYRDRLDDEALENVEWALEMARSCYRGFDEALYEIPIGLEVGAPFIARADHFEAAGLSIEDDFPPENYEHLVQVATQLQEEGPGEYGFQIYGEHGDVTDEALVTWTASKGGYDGTYLDEEWSDVNYDNDIWKEATEQYVDLYREHGLSSEKAATASNEGAAQMLIQGEVSMYQGSTKGFGQFMSRAEEMIRDGTIVFGPSWEGDAGNRGDFFTQCVALMRKPDGVPEEAWQEREEMAIQWINKLLSADFQAEVPKSLATLPVRRDVWSDLEEDEALSQSNYISTLETTVEGMEHGWSSHPKMNAIQYNIAGPRFQEAIRGKISAEEACTRTAEEIRNQVDL